MHNLLLQQCFRIIFYLVAKNPLARDRFIADKTVCLHIVFKHDGRADLHGHTVHFLLPVQLLLKDLSLRDIYNSALQDIFTFRRGSHNHSGTLHPVDRTVFPDNAVLIILVIPDFIQPIIYLMQNFPVFRAHCPKHTFLPVPHPLFYTVISHQ